ncbi:hypothetical protein NDU88_004009 [Pleurodeles waltl]|uniref:Uncharacterized protein n=1 Tax=Pleurodeles waltl TaxID=8319 RepID=A0AAV7NMC3_PLEWA|nr:hypothetical protein NDU88_004009 [Pleurodeles waltl]
MFFDVNSRPLYRHRREGDGWRGGGGEARAPLVSLQSAWTIQGLGVGPSFSRCRSPCARSFIWASMQGSNPCAGGMMVYIVYCSERFLRGPRAFKKLPEPPVMFRGRKEQAPPADLEPPALQMCCADFSACPPLVEGRGARLVADPRAGGGNHQESSPATSPPLRPTPAMGRLSSGRGGRGAAQSGAGPSGGPTAHPPRDPPPSHPHLTFGAQGRSSGPRYEAKWRPQFPRRRRQEPPFSAAQVPQ